MNRVIILHNQGGGLFNSYLGMHGNVLIIILQVVVNFVENLDKIPSGSIAQRRGLQGQRGDA